LNFEEPLFLVKAFSLVLTDSIIATTVRARIVFLFGGVVVRELYWDPIVAWIV
jgi:hypothetical protein